jgi:2-keto-4-pentenoate hydratase/2-oxohepta-3-ene-1,7-dioic acid hydratase in catechol pathway
VTLLPPIESSFNVFGVGLNYWSHLRGMGLSERPPSTLAFLKPYEAIVGHEEEIIHSVLTKQLDFEVELVAVIGTHLSRGAKDLTEGVLGYTVGNDVSARDAASPLGGPDLFSMKALERSTPLGPWIVTKDELGGAGQPDLELQLKVDGDVRQRDRTKNMLWNVHECLEYVLDRVPLKPGDVLFTGTPSGCGAEDGRYLQPGQLVEASIEGIGMLRNVVGVSR